MSSLSGCNEWTAFGGGAGHTFSNGDRTSTAADVGNLVPLWSFGAAYPHLLVWRDRVVVIGGSTSVSVTGLDTATGQQEWTLAGIAPSATSAIQDGVLYLPYFNLSSGCTPHGGCSPTSNSGIRAVSVEDGQERADLTQTFATNSMIGPIGFPALSAEHKVIPLARASYDSGTGAFDYTSWVTVDGVDVGAGGSGVIDVSVDDATDRAYVALHASSSGTDHLRALSLPSGQVLWDVEQGANIPAATAQIVEAYPRMFDPATGNQLWQADRALTGYPAVVGDRVFSSTSDGLAAYEACGSDVCAPLWLGEADAGYGFVAASGDLVYVANQDDSTSTLRVYDADGCGQSTCDPIATWDQISGRVNDLAATGGRVFVATSTGVHAYGLPAN